MALLRINTYALSKISIKLLYNRFTSKLIHQSLYIRRMGCEMVKGATKRVVEIKETGSQFFEKAIFFVNMESQRHTKESTLSQEARRIIDRYSSDKKVQELGGRSKKGDIIISLLKLVGSAAFGAFVTLLFTEIL